MILNLEDVKDIFHGICDNFPLNIRIRTGRPVPFSINNMVSRQNPDPIEVSTDPRIKISP